MGAHTSKNGLDGLHTPHQLIERAAQTFTDEIKEAKLAKIASSLEKKLTTGVKFDEWIETYVAEDPEKAHKLVLAAVKAAESIQNDILDAVQDGVLKIGMSYHKVFYVLISYIMQYTKTDHHGQFIRRFDVEFTIPLIERPYTVDEAIRIFPAESVVNDRVVVRDNYLGYRLPQYMMKTKEAASVGLMQ